MNCVNPLLARPVTIFVRPTGNDADGDGSEANPFRTRQRASREWEYVPAGLQVTMDVTGIDGTPPRQEQRRLMRAAAKRGRTTR